MDMTKVMADFNPAKIVDQFTKIASNFQIQQIDLHPIIVAQRENIEALAATNQAATESLQALAARQNEILRKALIEATEAESELSQADGPQEATAEQADPLKASFERTLRNIKEINELAA